MANQFADYPRLLLINNRLGFNLSAVTDFDLAAELPGPVTGVPATGVRVTFDCCEESPPGSGIVTVRTVVYGGDDAAALRKYLPAICARVDK